MSISTLSKNSTLAAGAVSLIGLTSLFAAPSYAANLTNIDLTGAATIGNVTINNGTATLNSGSSTNANSVESFLGLASGTLSTIGNISPTSASALKTTVTAKAGDTLSFDWFFQAGDYLPYNDFSFYSITSAASLLANVALVGDFGQISSNTAYTFVADGIYTLGFGVSDALDTANNSTLQVSNVVKTTSVPEPASVLGLLAFSAMGTGSILKRKQQQKATVNA